LAEKVINSNFRSYIDIDTNIDIEYQINPNPIEPNRIESNQCNALQCNAMQWNRIAKVSGDNGNHEI